MTALLVGEAPIDLTLYNTKLCRKDDFICYPDHSKLLTVSDNSNTEWSQPCSGQDVSENNSEDSLINFSELFDIFRSYLVFPNILPRGISLSKILSEQKTWNLHFQPFCITFEHFIYCPNLPPAGFARLFVFHSFVQCSSTLLQHNTQQHDWRLVLACQVLQHILPDPNSIRMRNQPAPPNCSCAHWTRLKVCIQATALQIKCSQMFSCISNCYHFSMCTGITVYKHSIVALP